ncbi:MAG TPA: hypothetical protein VFI03_06775 [Solirubrobacterales bacterium]|nr:hypothetical protein [Solirubrobacterales bacterium]
MRRGILVCLLPVLAGLAFPAFAAAAAQVSVAEVEGLDVVVINDDGSSTELETAYEVDAGTMEEFVAIQSSDMLTSLSAGCTVLFPPTIATCMGEFDAVVAFANSGEDEVTMDLIAPGLTLRGEAYGGPGDDRLEVQPNFADVPQPEAFLDGEIGEDMISGGTGADELRGGAGDDVIEARDGVEDIVNCGPGDDRADVDANDLLDSSCELGPSPQGPAGDQPRGSSPASLPPHSTCVVPKLTGKKLKPARKTLVRSQCRLGKVSGKRGKTARVGKQSPKPGAVRAAGAAVNVTLDPPRPQA